MYSEFAYVYDALMHDVDYEKIAEYVIAIFEQEGQRADERLVLDLGCGTGNLTMQLMKRGYDMIALDASSDMLSVLADKCADLPERPLILQGTLTDFELYGTVDGIVCMMDTLNYLPNTAELEKMFRLAYLYLNPGGILVFDMNTCYKLENILGNHVFYEIGDTVSYIWQNHYDNEAKKCQFDLTFFVKEEANDERYRKFEETQWEFGYENEEITIILQECGFQKSKVYEMFTFAFPKETCDRCCFVAVKPR